MKSLRPLLACVVLVASVGCVPDVSVPPPGKSGSCETPPVGLDPLLDAFPPCDLNMCGPNEADRSRGLCVDANQLSPDQIAQLGPCGTSYPSYCVPTKFFLANGFTHPPTCRSLNSAEGRCMSLCIPDIQEKKDQLPRDVCEVGELCAPCFDPVTGDPTGACTTSSCDMPVNTTPVLFPRCCSGRAVCLPKNIVPADKQGSLSQKDCASSNDLCVPEENTDLSYHPPTCQTTINGPGACTSTCIDSANLFQRQNCVDPNHRCVPCKVAGVSTGACF